MCGCSLSVTCLDATEFLHGAILLVALGAAPPTASRTMQLSIWAPALTAGDGQTGDANSPQSHTASRAGQLIVRTLRQTASHSLCSDHILTTQCDASIPHVPIHARTSSCHADCCQRPSRLRRTCLAAALATRARQKIRVRRSRASEPHTTPMTTPRCTAVVSAVSRLLYSCIM